MAYHCSGRVMTRDKDHLSCFNKDLNCVENIFRLNSTDFIIAWSYSHVTGISIQTPHWQLNKSRKQQNESWMMNIEFKIVEISETEKLFISLLVLNWTKAVLHKELFIIIHKNVLYMFIFIRCFLCNRGCGLNFIIEWV